MRLALLAALALTLAACGGIAGKSHSVLPPRLMEQASGVDQLLIAAHAVDEDVVWASGAGGTVVKTTDGGATWQAVPVTTPGADTLQFRDVVALDATTAWALSIGNGASSQIAKTTDGGATWRTVYQATDADAFYDCLGMWDAQRGVAYGDSYDGRLRLLTTADGGDSWRPVPASALPAPAEGEGGFAASGTCVATRGAGRAWIATGNADPARILRTTDGGASWTAATLPIVAGEAAGATSVTFRDDRNGVAVGGDLAVRDDVLDTVAITSDGGATWTLGGALPFPGAAYGAAYVPGSDALLAVGPGGAGLSRDDGRTWVFVDDRTFWGVAAASREAAWLVGPDGRIVRVRL
ncbi:WD40/YVTN/BNR-like repeat-containing protein [Rubrivirga sp. IMCC45206]|uniref:WD40/YVTN/BNR-like repeat-containing protein n=1 Tax=Rubrivirga sp. IMCC45206 TaxID=3391614 RepID=UPI00398FA0F4